VQFDLLTGPEKAAIFILSIPATQVSTMMSRLEDEQIEQILAAVSRFEDVPPSIQERVLNEFQDSVGTREVAIRGGRELALHLLETTLDPERSGPIRKKLGRDEKRVDWTLRPYEPAFIAEIIGDEHPQTIALILSQIPSNSGAAVISALSEDKRPEVVLRLAELETVSSEVVHEVEEEVAFLFARRRVSPTRVGGTEYAAKLLNRVNKPDGATILEGVDTHDPDLAGEIRKRMLTFNDLSMIDQRGFQSLLREVPTEDLVLALKTASEEMQEKIFSNVSSRAADQIKEEMDLLGPMRISEVERIQLQIVDIARRLEDEGKLTIDSGSSDDALV
jgi:flagellar motor switch protein FliG